MDVYSPFVSRSVMGISRAEILYEFRFGTFGAGQGQLTEPSGIAVTPDGDIAVTDTNNHRVQVYDSNGKFKFHFGEHGKKNGHFLHPNRIAVNPSNSNFVVTERTPSTRIQVFDEKGNFLRCFGFTVLQHPRGVTVDKNGMIAVIECKIMRVVIFDWYGNLAHSFYCTGHLQFPNNICCNDEQQVFITDNRLHCVKVFNYNGQFVRQIGDSGLTNFPIGVAVDSQGHTIVVDNHKFLNITVFDKDGEVKDSFKSAARHLQCFDLVLLSGSRLAVVSKDCNVYVYHYDQSILPVKINESSLMSLEKKDTLPEWINATPNTSMFDASGQLNFDESLDLWKPLPKTPVKSDADDFFLASTPVHSFAGDNALNETPRRQVSTPQFYSRPSFPQFLDREVITFESCFGSYGIGKGQFTELSGIAVTPDQDIAVTDMNNHRVQVYDRFGNFKFQFGEQGKESGQLLYPSRIAVNPLNGNFVINERLPSTQLHVFDKNGVFLRRFGGNVLQHPRGLAIDEQNGFVVVVECKIMRVVVFDWYGNVIYSFSCLEHFSFPNSICCNGKGEVFVSDNRLNCVKVFNYQGQFLRQIGGDGFTYFPIGVGIDSAGNIIVCDNHRTFNITVFDQDGVLKKSFKSNARHLQCFDMAVLADGSIAMCSKDCKIYIYRYADDVGAIEAVQQVIEHLQV